jgi:mannosidase alpha-like ER degradation enhancer 1
MEIIRPTASDGCNPISLDNPVDPTEPFAIFLDRGDCTFLEKLDHATRAGAAGVIVAGLPPTTDSEGGIDEDGLLRPSAEAEPSSLLKDVENTGLLYVDWRTGDILRQIFSTGEKIIQVEVLGLDGQDISNDDLLGAAPTGQVGAGKATREGRVAVGEWAIWNLRIVGTN